MNVSLKNSSLKPLISGDKFIGKAQNCSKYYSLLINLRSDTECKVTLKISSNGQIWNTYITNTTLKCMVYLKTFEIFFDFVYVVVENISNSDQTYFNLKSTLYKKKYSDNIFPMANNNYNITQQLPINNSFFVRSFRSLNVTTNAELVGNIGQIYLCSITAFNKSSAERYLKIYDLKLRATYNDNSLFTIPLYPQSTYVMNYLMPIFFEDALWIRGTVNMADNDTDEPSENDIVVILTYIQ